MFSQYTAEERKGLFSFPLLLQTFSVRSESPEGNALADLHILCYWMNIRRKTLGGYGKERVKRLLKRTCFKSSDLSSFCENTM